MAFSHESQQTSTLTGSYANQTWGCDAVTDHLPPPHSLGVGEGSAPRNPNEPAVEEGFPTGKVFRSQQ